MANTTAKKSAAKKERKKRVSDFSGLDKFLISATSLVALGGVMFCAIMILLMTSINY